MIGIQLLFPQYSPDSWMSDTNLHWYPSYDNSHVHEGGAGYLKMFSYLDIFVLDAFLSTNDKPTQHYSPPNHTWNAYRLGLDLSPSSQQLAITARLTHNYWTLLVRFGNFPRCISRSHITTDSQSASLSRCLAPLGAGDQMLHLLEWQLLSLFFM
jgi:hypothetical protein